ncbi:response regulator [bacterium]|nr:response regulator [bacterium]
MAELRKVLIVEDSDLIHKMYQVILMRYRKNGTQLIHAVNGIEGLNKLNEHPDTDLILLDINMPVMSGFEFLRRIKQEKVFQSIPVIIVSTEGKDEDTARGLEQGARGYIKKPFQASDLYRLIERLFLQEEPILGNQQNPPQVISKKISTQI